MPQQGFLGVNYSSSDGESDNDSRKMNYGGYHHGALDGYSDSYSHFDENNEAHIDRTVFLDVAEFWAPGKKSSCFPVVVP